jgi:AcrR family transcriptional regulator
MSTYHHGNLRPALLRAAGKMLEREGPAGISLRDAARRAGVSHNAPYRHFPDRDALLAELAAQGFEMLGDAMRDRAGNEMGEAYVRFALEHPQRFRLMFGGTLPLAKHDHLRDAASATYQALVKAFGELPKPELAAAAAWALVHGLAHLKLDGHLGAQSVADVLCAVRFVQRAG